MIYPNLLDMPSQFLAQQARQKTIQERQAELEKMQKGTPSEFSMNIRNGISGLLDQTGVPQMFQPIGQGVRNQMAEFGVPQALHNINGAVRTGMEMTGIPQMPNNIFGGTGPELPTLPQPPQQNQSQLSSIMAILGRFMGR